MEESFQLKLFRSGPFSGTCTIINPKVDISGPFFGNSIKRTCASNGTKYSYGLLSSRLYLPTPILRSNVHEIAFNHFLIKNFSVSCKVCAMFAAVALNYRENFLLLFLLSFEPTDAFVFMSVCLFIS